MSLEENISEWRKQMIAAGIQTPVPLEELETHLREEIERQLKSGLSEQRALEISAQKIGQPQALKGEFKKSERTFMKISMGIFGVMVGAALMLPGSIQLHDELVMANGRLALWLLGMILFMWSFDLFRQIIRPEASGEKSRKAKTPFMKQIVKTVAGVIVLLTGLTFMMPAAAQAGRDGMVKFDSLGYLVFGVALLIAGVLVTFFPYQRRKA